MHVITKPPLTSDSDFHALCLAGMRTLVDLKKGNQPDTAIFNLIADRLENPDDTCLFANSALKMRHTEALWHFLRDYTKSGTMSEIRDRLKVLCQDIRQGPTTHESFDTLFALFEKLFHLSTW